MAVCNHLTPLPFKGLRLIEHERTKHLPLLQLLQTLWNSYAILTGCSCFVNRLTVYVQQTYIVAGYTVNNFGKCQKLNRVYSDSASIYFLKPKPIKRILW